MNEGVGVIENLLRDSFRRLRARLRGGRVERALRGLVSSGPKPVRRLAIHLVPQPGQFDPAERREVVVGGAAFTLHPHEFIQWVHYFGWPDPNFEALACLAEGAGCVLDVGANVGLYSLRLASREPGCRVIAIEAHPGTFGRLQAHLERNPMLQVEAVNVGVAAQPGVLTLHDFEGDDSGFTSAVERPGVRIMKSVEVQATTIDDFVRARGLEPGVMKLDVEGFEPDALVGSAETLRRLKPDVVVEWTSAWTTGREATVRRAVRLLEDGGYRVFRVPSGQSPKVEELPLRSLTEQGAPQLNAVLTTREGTPARLERWFRRVGS